VDTALVLPTSALDDFPATEATEPALCSALAAPLDLYPLR
jgi:hypothetical protein